MKTNGRVWLLSFIFMISFIDNSAREISVEDFETRHYDWNIEIDYTSEMVYGNCRITIENVSNRELSVIPMLLLPKVGAHHYYKYLVFVKPF